MRKIGEDNGYTFSIFKTKSILHGLSQVRDRTFYFFWKGDKVIGKLEILPTVSGNILKALIENNVSVGVSSRGMGSLKEINEGTLEVQDDLKIDFPKNGNLERWAKQGVFLLNSILTVEECKPNCHSGIGWEQFTDAIIHKISTEKSQLVFLLWGTKAIAKKEIIDCKKHLVLTAPHPSPLSAYRGFFGCKHFSQTNKYFRKLGITEINW